MRAPPLSLCRRRRPTPCLAILVLVLVLVLVGVFVSGVATGTSASATSAQGAGPTPLPLPLYPPSVTAYHAQVRQTHRQTDRCACICAHRCKRPPRMPGTVEALRCASQRCAALSPFRRFALALARRLLAASSRLLLPTALDCPAANPCPVAAPWRRDAMRCDAMRCDAMRCLPLCPGP